MKERPILFKAPMVLALNRDWQPKTQTRRLVKSHGKDSLGKYNSMPLILGESFHQRYKCPYGVPGDRLWVREGHLVRGAGTVVDYRADMDRIDAAGHGALYGGWKPSIHMFRKHSRFDLEVTAIRVERLHDISDADALAEGIYKLSKDNARTWKYGIPDSDGLPGSDDHGWEWAEWCLTPREAFLKLFAKINGQKVVDDNPWLWVVTFVKL